MNQLTLRSGKRGTLAEGRPASFPHDSRGPLPFFLFGRIGLEVALIFPRSCTKAASSRRCLGRHRWSLRGHKGRWTSGSSHCAKLVAGLRYLWWFFRHEISDLKHHLRWIGIMMKFRSEEMIWKQIWRNYRDAGLEYLEPFFLLVCNSVGYTRFFETSRSCLSLLFSPRFLVSWIPRVRHLPLGPSLFFKGMTQPSMDGAQHFGGWSTQHHDVQKVQGWCKGISPSRPKHERVLTYKGWVISDNFVNH